MFLESRILFVKLNLLNPFFWVMFLKMGCKKNSSNCELIFVDNQACVKAFRKADFPQEYKKNIEKFISRNVIPDCGRVAPNCLKAHMIKTAKKFGLKNIDKIKGLFRARVGFNGFYLDGEKLRRV